MDSLTEKEFDLFNVLDDIESLMSQRAEKKKIPIVFKYDNNISRYIKTDENKLSQILINLIGNAVKFTVHRNITLQIREEKASGNNTRLFFDVIDTGPGIAADDIGHIFESFTQTKHGHDSQEGTGLGLTICRELVNLLGGNISVKSKVGKGTTFSFTITVEIVSSDKIELKKISRPVIGIQPGSNSSDGTPYRILIVEDKFENRALLCSLLREVGFDCREAENGQEAVELFSSYHPHLIWMDIRMPLMDGYEAIKHIRSISEKDDFIINPVIVALTASVFEEEKVIALEKGCDDELSKSILTLSPEIISKLREAAELSDIIQVDDVINLIYTENKKIAESLEQYSKDFAYDKILSIISLQQ